MAGSRTLKNRIKSTKNIRQMTRAMEAVSAVKMRRSVGLALSSRPYALAALRMFEYIEAGTAHETIAAPLAIVRPKQTQTLVVITSDRGLAGAFNTQVLKAADRFVETSPCPVSIIAIGKKGREYFSKKNLLETSFIGTGDFGAVEETTPITRLLEQRFRDQETDAISICYTNFVSALKQEVVTEEILPFTERTLRSFIHGVIPERGRYQHVPKLFELPDAPPHLVTIEPNPALLLDQLLTELLSIEIHHAILEANASEHASRMMAMKSASENAGELTETLTILYNKARQAHITKELSEITAGKEALQTT